VLAEEDRLKDRSAMGTDGQDAEHAAAAYRLILLMRRFEEKAGQLYAMGLIPDEIKLCIGREALIAGLYSARRDCDPLVVGRRCHGALLAFGLAPERIMTELAHPTGALFDHPFHRSGDSTLRPAAFYRCPTGNGERMRWALSLAMGQSVTPTPNVIFVILDGDTLVREDVERALVFAQRSQLPIVFVIDHAVPDSNPGQACNQRPSHQIQTAVQESSICFSSIDGIDAQNVMERCHRAGEAARSGAGPQGLIASTHAFRGHASLPNSAAAGGGSEADHDPVARARARLVDESDGRPDTAVAIETDVRTTLTSIGLTIRAQARL